MLPVCRWLSVVPVLLALAACGGGSGSGEVSSTAAPRSTPIQSPSPSLKPAKPDSQWASVLVDCVAAELITDSCTLSQLPLIGMQISEPDIEDIMDRLVVSHDWMAVRFRQLLQRYPADMRLMMRSLTAIVISDEIRPSYYTTGTGAIYLDPDRLWLTSAERAVVPDDPDPRSSFDDDLAFVSLWRYVSNFSYAWGRQAPPRSLEDIELPMATLLFHELAHANDFFPASTMHQLVPRLSVYLNASLASDRRLSNNLDQPTSTLLKGLAEVMYFGESPSQPQLQLQPLQVGAEFGIDSASAMYSYSNQYEDFAMLVEEVLMNYHYDLQRDAGFTNRPAAGSPRSDYVLAWGMRQRAFDPLVRNRSIRALQLLFNQSDVSRFFPPASASQLLDTGVSWDASILTGAPVLEKASRDGATRGPVPDLQQPLFRPFDPARMAP